MDYVNKFEGGLAKETEGVTVLPGVLDLLKSIPTEDWTVNTAGTITMAVSRLSQFNIHVPKEMATGDKVKKMSWFWIMMTVDTHAVIVDFW